jgi:NADPH-dependent curcumin reductase CurA
MKSVSPRPKEVPMVAPVNRQILLNSRPEGAPSLDNFTLKEGPVPDPGDGEVLMRTRWLSLDPYMRGRMSAAKSYAKPVEVGATMVGGTVGEVVASRNPNFAVGDIAMGYGGWQDYAVANGSGLRKLDPAAAPVSTALGVLGMPGMTAYAGLLEIGRPTAGETVAVAAASGAVGSVVGQIAKIKGCRAVGIAGGPDKCRFVVEELGFDACIDHRAGDFSRQLEAACPAGIDVYFEDEGKAQKSPSLRDFQRGIRLRVAMGVTSGRPAGAFSAQPYVGSPRPGTRTSGLPTGLAGPRVPTARPRSLATGPAIGSPRQPGK